MRWSERAAFRDMLLREHVATFGRVYFCQIFLDGIDYTRVKLHAHHIFPAALWPERRLDTSNGVLIRYEHHVSLHRSYSLEEVPDALKSYVEDNYSAYCRWYKNLVLPNGKKFPNAWTLFLVSKGLLDRSNYRS